MVQGQMAGKKERGRVPRLRILPVSSLLSGRVVLLAPSFLPTSTSASQHSPGSAMNLLGPTWGQKPRALLVVHEECWARGAEGVRRLVRRTGE